MAIDTMFDARVWAAVPFHFWSLVFFGLGCIVGSFLNVCIYRLPLGLSVVSPPSHCPRCQHAIPFYLNIPLVTWLALRGRCHECAAAISPRYLVVELLTGLLFLACWLQFGAHSAWLAGADCLLLAGLIVATFIDLEHFIIPDEITLGGAVAGVLLSAGFPVLHDAATRPAGLVRGLAGLAFGAGVMYAILRLGKLLFGRQTVQLPPGSRVMFTETALHLPDRELAYEELFYRPTDVIKLRARRVELVDRSYREELVELSPDCLRIGGEMLSPDSVPFLEADCVEIVLPREAMGLGDVKFMGAIGAFLGWQGALFALMASSMIGASVGVGLIALRKRDWSSRIPYGPYIALGAVVWVFWGPAIVRAIFAR